MNASFQCLYFDCTSISNARAFVARLAVRPSVHPSIRSLVHLSLLDYLPLEVFLRQIRLTAACSIINYPQFARTFFESILESAVESSAIELVLLLELFLIFSDMRKLGARCRISKLPTVFEGSELRRHGTTRPVGSEASRHFAQPGASRYDF